MAQWGLSLRKVTAGCLLGWGGLSPPNKCHLGGNWLISHEAAELHSAANVISNVTNIVPSLRPKLPRQSQNCDWTPLKHYLQTVYVTKYFSQFHALGRVWVGGWEDERVRSPRLIFPQTALTQPDNWDHSKMMSACQNPQALFLVVTLTSSSHIPTSPQQRRHLTRLVSLCTLEFWWPYFTQAVCNAILH